MKLVNITSRIQLLSFTYIILILFIATCNLFSQSSEKKVIHSLMGAPSISLETGGTLGYTDYANTSIDFIWRGSAEYFFETFTNHLVGIKGFFGTGSINGNQTTKIPPEFKTDLTFYGLGLIYGYLVSDKVLPTASASLSNLSFDPKDRNGNKLPNNDTGVYSTSDVNLNLELGLRYFVANDLALLANIGVALNFHDWLDDVEKGNNNDIFYTGYVGLSYTIGAKTDEDNDGVEDSEDLCPNTPEGLKVDINGCPVDTDRDGVPDYLDLCSNTPARVRVNENGCPLDSDRDGVPDFVDRCPRTPPNIRVNRYGCPLDSDGDRIPDFMDRCPGTQRGVRVDSVGCPIDSDRDGVPNFADKCPNTPRGIQVNQFGCPLDSDGDGVPDFADKCPNTPLGTPVTLDGCSDKFQEYIFDASTIFNAGEAIITVNSYDELDKVIARIKLRPSAHWRIEGHTDNQGGAEFNKVLSFQRSQAVYNYFLSRGLDSSKFEVVGLGEDFPIADNSTETGRRVNRRVVLIRIE
jgi:outer membrane protein OmpA-like peptidoglycan-associated protein